MLQHEAKELLFCDLEKQLAEKNNELHQLKSLHVASAAYVNMIKSDRKASQADQVCSPILYRKCAI